MAKKKFKFHWKGKSEPQVGEGVDVADAFSNLGYGAGAMAALDYYEEVSETPLMEQLDYIKWEVEFWKSKDSKHLRLGQAFLNQNHPNISNSDLYYEKNTDKARAMIHDQYVVPYNGGTTLMAREPPTRPFLCLNSNKSTWRK